ncbi:hypothetical protein [Chelativorans sp. Marseille-P2723]|uniref:hypothetical protein n=1 Tax=Chelativorans sp. Marseille-P2723 TaxID=2709133 RepID=UPI00156E453F|nr:hypothetical protein [Chelativorans sp. Marseille-P2723]
MFRKIRVAAISAILGLGTLAGAPATAQADRIYFSIGGNGAQGGFFVGHRPGWHPPHRGAHRVRACTPDRAVEKARRLGLRKVRVTRADRHTIRVSGQKHRHRAQVVFSRAPHCPVLRFI